MLIAFHSLYKVVVRLFFVPFPPPIMRDCDTFNHLITVVKMSLLTKKLATHLEPTTTQDEFTELNKDRLNWNVTDLPSEPFTQFTPGISECFSRITALGLELELPVGSFIRAAIEQVDKIPPTAIAGMIANIIDEEKHFDAFNRIAKIYSPSIQDLQQAKTFRKALIHYKINPIAKARDLETLLFLPIQSIMRVYGGEALERVIGDISHDEYRHTNFGWELSVRLGIPRNTDFEDVCLGVFGWVLEPLNGAISKIWKGIGEDMRCDGSSDLLDKMLNYGIHKAPFEISNAYY